MNVRPLETSVRDLAPATLVYVIRDGWALAYRAEMLDDRANELYVMDEMPGWTLRRAYPPSMSACWADQLSDDYVLKSTVCDMARDAAQCAWRTEREHAFRTRYGLPVDKVQHPR